MATLFGMDRNRITTMFLVMFWSRFSVSVITDVQLVGGPDSNKGTIEIKIDNGTWETVCGTNFDTTDVILICQHLGFKGANRATQQTLSGQNPTPNHGLFCDENDTSLSECSLVQSSGCSSAGAASCHGDRYLGCFVDMSNARALSGESQKNSSSITITYCIQFCNESITANYTYAGVENGNECYCGEGSDNYTQHGVGPDMSDKNCQFPCSGDPTESCGGSGYIAVFISKSIICPAAMVTTMNTPTESIVTSPPPTTSEVTSTNQTATTSNENVISTSLSSSSSVSSSLKTEGTSNLPTVGNSTGLYAGIGGGVAAVIIIIIIIVAVAYTRKRRAQQRTKSIASSPRTTLPPASRHPAYDEINDFGIPNGAMAEASSARSYQPGAQAHSSANSCRGDKNVLLVNLNPRKSSNIYEGTMDETPDTELTSYASHGATAVKQNSDNRLSVLYATPDKNGNGAQDGYDEINLGIAPYSSFENPKQPTATAKMADRMSVVYAAPDKNDGRNGTSEDMDSLYAMPDKNGNRNNPSDDTSEDVGSLYAMPDKSRGKPDGYDGDEDLYAKTNDSFSGDQYNEMDMVENELYAM
ncbi:uncharacterized protein LOC121430584 [Lytechinus variegatus]|uniref:uncharacterized protein LOC121430584 n=1 Tax=Lytechinus variegatus TaxID=7654 RepID=UPI001BB2A350|nr:uncharacterized protein LOC121430584 [Lytechinus variegatus]